MSVKIHLHLHWVDELVPLLVHHQGAHLDLLAVEVSRLDGFGLTAGSNPSFYKGMTEFQEGEVSVICRKIILIHGQGPGFCYLQVKGFK